MAQLNNELAEKELIKKFRHDNSWLGELKSKNNWVSNNVIKVPRQGADPLVLINNTVYPIASNNRTDDFITLSLNKYDTENTNVTKDELYALAYEKVNDVQVQHRETLEDKTAEHALFSLAISAANLTTPVLETTGPNDGTGRLRLTTKDLLNLWLQLGQKGVPLSGRVIVLSAEHAADLMIEDEARGKAWGGDFQQGVAGVVHAGFKLWVSNYSPNYKKVLGVWTRQAFGATVSGMQPASIVFYKNNACKATGTVERFAIEASQNPLFRQHTIGFQLYFIAVGLKDEGFAAIVSGTAA